MIEEAGKAAAAWAGPREKGERRDPVAEPVADMVKTFSKLSEYWLSDPGRALEAQTRLFSGYLNVWANTIRRVGSEAPVPDVVQPERQADLSGDGALGGRPRRARRRPRRAHAAQGDLLRQADLPGDLAVELHPHQSRAVPRDGRLARREPGARHAHAGGGHPGGQRRP
jgi:hypothetical protein